MNTRFLKSSKLLKLLKDCGLLKGQSRLPGGIKKGANQITLVEMDLAFKQICFKGMQQKAYD